MRAMTEICALGSCSLVVLLAVHGCAVGGAAAGTADSEASPVGSREALTQEACSGQVRRLTDGSYARLSDTGLYCDLEGDVFNEEVEFYEPAFSQWADGAHKRRFLSLPPGTQIDTSDMDHWVFPIGTKVWKEFTVDGKKVETRLLEKTGQHTWLAIAFAWTAEGDDAYPALNGAANALGTRYDIPSANECSRCHSGSADMLLGVSAIQLGAGSDAMGVNLSSLLQNGQLSDPPPADVGFPGTKEDQLALGYLYANCSSCHGSLRATAGLDLSTSVYDQEVTDTAAYQTTVNERLRSWLGHGYSMRIVPGAPQKSGLLARIASRDPANQMPPVGELVDRKGVRQVRKWIKSLRTQPSG